MAPASTIRAALGVASLAMLNTVNIADRYIYGTSKPPFLSQKIYGLTSGPAFYVIFTCTGLLTGTISDSISHRPVLIGTTALAWSAAVAAVAMSTREWHVILSKCILGLFQAFLNPLAVSLFASSLSAEWLDLAISIMDLGIYAGFALASGPLVLASTNLGWHSPFYILGAAGAGIAILVMALFAGTPEKTKPRLSEGQSEERMSSPLLSETQQHEASDRNTVVRESWLKDPFAAQVCIAAGVRNAGGCVFGAYAYVRGADDSGTFFGPMGVRKVSSKTLANFMTWIPFLGGSAGVLMGGYWLKYKRRASENGGDGCGEELEHMPSSNLEHRLSLLAFSCIASSPFALGVLILPVPYCFLSLLIAVIVGEMWIGVCLALVVDMMPAHTHGISIGIYYFIVANLGGNMPFVIPYVAERLSLRMTLILFYPCLYLLAGLIFVKLLLSCKHRLRDSTSGG